MKTRIDFRLEKSVKNKIQMLANLYAGGNISKWLTHGGLNAPRMFIEDREKILDHFKGQKSRARRHRRARTLKPKSKR